VFHRRAEAASCQRALRAPIAAPFLPLEALSMGVASWAVWLSLALLSGSVLVVVLIGRRVRRHQRDIDGELEREYRDPPPFQWNGPL
jgi:hypothetical protein